MKTRRNGFLNLAVVLLLGLSLWGPTGCSDLESMTSPTVKEEAGSSDDATPVSEARMMNLPDVEPLPDTDAPEVPAVADKAGRVLTMYARDCWRLYADWQNVSGAVGQPGPNDNQNQNVFAYDEVMGSSDRLWSRGYRGFTLLPGERITGVYVDVNARYDSGTSANVVRLFVNYPLNGTYPTVSRDAGWSQSSTDDAFRWRMGGSYGWNITGLRSSWTLADVADTWVGARRFTNNDPIGTSRCRVNAFRIVVTTAS